MITFKSNDDLQKLPSDDPAHPVVVEMVEHLNNAYTMPGHPYDPENSGYVALKDIQAALTGTFSSIPLHPLFKGKSVNTPAFLLAVLKHEKLLRSVKPNRYEWIDLKAFTAQVTELIESKTDLDPDRAPPRKRSMPKKNQNEQAHKMLVHQGGPDHHPTYIRRFGNGFHH